MREDSRIYKVLLHPVILWESTGMTQDVMTLKTNFFASMAASA